MHILPMPFLEMPNSLSTSGSCMQQKQQVWKCQRKTIAPLLLLFFLVLVDTALAVNWLAAGMLQWQLSPNSLLFLKWIKPGIADTAEIASYQYWYNSQ